MVAIMKAWRRQRQVRRAARIQYEMYLHKIFAQKSAYRVISQLIDSIVSLSVIIFLCMRTLRIAERIRAVITLKNEFCEISALNLKARRMWKSKYYKTEERDHGDIVGCLMEGGCSRMQALILPLTCTEPVTNHETISVWAHILLLRSSVGKRNEK